jgi:photosystem II stability/assembly factor-like uncharacterized protein
MGDGLFVTRDGGNNWQPVLMEERERGEDTFKNHAVWAVKIAQSSSLIVWAAHNYWVAGSTDGGETWTHILNSTMQRDCTGCGGEGDNFRFCTALAIDPTDPQTVYVGTRGPLGTYLKGGVYRTKDGGVTWTKLNQGTDFDYSVTDLKIDPQNSTTIWITTSSFGQGGVWAGSLYRSGDGGETWTAVFSVNAGMTSVAVQPDDSNIVFTGSGYGIIKHFFDGAQWQYLWPVIPEDVGCRVVEDIVFDPQNPRILYAPWKNPYFGDFLPKLSRSVDAGVTWETYVVDYQFLTLAIDPTAAETVYGGDANLGVFKSGNHGQTWTPKNNGINAVITYDVAVDPKEPTHILAGTISGIYEKKQGSAWSRILMYDTGAVEFDPRDSATIYAGLWGYVAKTTDGGQGWAFSRYSDGSGKVYDIEVDPVEAGTFYIAVGSTGSAGTIYKTSDGGVSFSNILTGQNLSGQPYDFNVVTIDPSNSRHVFAGGGNFYAPKVYGDLWESTDAGVSWTRNSLSTLDVIVNDLLIDPSNPLILYAGCGYSGGVDVPVYKSTDAGGTWKESFTGIPADASWNAVTDLAFHRLNTNIVYASTLEAGVYISPNKAKNWLNLEMPGYSVYAVSSGSLYAATSGLWQCTGTGVIAGQIMDDVTKTGIDLATVYNDLGVKTLSINGEYMMVTPVGIFSVTAVKVGYANQAVENIKVYGGDVSWADLSMKAAVSDQEVIPVTPADGTGQVGIPGGVLYPTTTGMSGGGDIGGGGCFISTIADGSR